jgi:hypothetical protein
MNVPNSPFPAPTRPIVSWLARLAITGVSLLLLVVACATPALVFRRNGTDDETWFGIHALAFGWMGVLIGQLAWFANIVAPIAVLCMLFRRWIVASVLTLIALVLAANTLLLFAQEIPADEAGVNKLVFEYPHVGFVFWIASIFVVLVGSIGCWIWERSRAS